MAGAAGTSRRASGTLRFRRVVVKLTGESFAPVGTFGLDADCLDALADKFVSAAKLGAQIAVVVGGGNFIRGASLSGWRSIRPVAAHQMGMLATVINGSALAEALTAKGGQAVLTCSMPAGNFTERYHPQKAQDDLSNGKIVILTGGTGNAFVTTDTCAAIRAADLQADAVLKATKVDAVYSHDPMTHPNAKKYREISFDEVIDERLEIMDIAAVTICQQADIPIIVFDVQRTDSVAKVLTGKLRGTKIGP